MQGPFTERFVGGHQHRHADNTGSTDSAGHRTLDGITARAEAWDMKVETAGVSFMHPNTARPRAMFLREEAAKRPVNIKNIKQVSGSVARHISGTAVSNIGNFRNHYELVMTSDRANNNRALIKSGSFTSGALTSTYVSGVFDYEKIVRR